MTLPAHICRVFSCDADLDRAQLSALLDQRGADDALPWFLSDKAAQDALVEAQFGGDEPTQFSAVEVFDGTESARYLEVVGVNGVLHQLLTVPEDGQADDAFPTAGLVSLAKVWPTQPDLFIEPDLSQLAEKYRNRLLVFTVGSAEKWDRQNLFQSLAALHGCKIHVGKNATSDPHWIAFGRIDIAAGSILSESALMAGRLLQEILFEGRIRWRYLALYRVFEAAYLIGLKETLLASFLDAPKDALSQAQEALASELALFKKLVEDKGLTARFELLRAMVDQDTSNRFLHAIKRSLRKSGSAGPMKGVEYAYKIRCAIVHAGQHDVVFDRFDDGENGVDLLLKTLEEAVFELLGLRGS